MKIVEQARAEQASTSGALHGGRVAEFLAAEPEGRSLVQSLAEARSEPVRAERPTPAPERPAQPDLGDLVRPAEAPAPQARPRNAPPEAPKGAVDRGLLDRLVDGEGGGS